MSPMRTRVLLILLLIAAICLSIPGRASVSSEASKASETSEASENVRISIPYTSKTETKARYVYVVGGYHSIDTGVPAWGSSNYADIRLIGDTMGTLDIEYTDGTVDSVPLIFGYTMWFYNNWKEKAAPFSNSSPDKQLKDVLTRSLMLKGAFEGNENCVFRIALRDKAIKKINVNDNAEKNGEPVFKNAFLVNDTNTTLSNKGLSFNASNKFFDTHTISSADPFPATIRNDLETLRHALYTYEEDYELAKPFIFPDGYNGPKIVFSGSKFADIASGVIYTNVRNLADRTDDDGFMHTSYKGAPSWRYDGFGVWVESADSYFDSFYSRDGGRGIMSLLLYGEKEKAMSASLFADRHMMYFRENKVTFKGSEVPGHYTVVVNKPMLYSEVLVPDANWPTSYTKKAFGDDYKNLGNQETDGHGLMMLANYNAWRSNGRSSEWVRTNWKYIKEACDWIEWCFDNPDLSLVKNGLLYAESEAGMMKYTLYCNVPCYLGLKGYAEMAGAAGYDQEAEKWLNIAAGLREAIISKNSNSKGWMSAKFGFYHDPVLTMMSDYYGFDTADMERDMVELSLMTYKSDTGKAVDNGWYGAPGIGYDHSMLTQNALLTDNMSDATALMENLCRLSYSPRLPEPYLVPEGISVDRVNDIIRRQGDLGNLVQLAEALKCYSIAAGISPVLGSTLKLMPRLPENWTLHANNAAISGDGSGKIDIRVTYPQNGGQNAQFTLKYAEGIDNVKLRLGPFPSDTVFVSAMLDGEFVSCDIVKSGDSIWAWIDCKAPSENEHRIAAVFGNDTGSIPQWPDDWTDTGTVPENGEKNTGFDKDNNHFDNKGFNTAVLITAIAAGAVIIAAALITVMIIKKKGRKTQ